MKDKKIYIWLLNLDNGKFEKGISKVEQVGDYSSVFFTLPTVIIRKKLSDYKLDQVVFRSNFLKFVSFDDNDQNAILQIQDFLVKQAEKLDVDKMEVHNVKKLKETRE